MKRDLSPPGEQNRPQPARDLVLGLPLSKNFRANESRARARTSARGRGASAISLRPLFTTAPVDAGLGILRSSSQPERVDCPLILGNQDGPRVD